ncbi:MAG: DegQ family serine endoprotease [Alphaproteobacteria bacterium]
MSFPSLRLRRSAALAGFVLLLGWSVGIPPAAARSAPDSFADTAERLLPSVVNISTTQNVTSDKPGERSSPGRKRSPLDEFFRDFLERNDQRGEKREPRSRKATSLGSGFIVDPAGYIVTNNHVIEGADEINVILHDDTRVKAEVLGRDSKTDVAVLRIKTDKTLVPAVWGDSDKARVGDWVLAIGNPFGLGGSVSAGILSARQRDIHSGPYDDYLQTDAAINRGNSGGPMFNTQGEVIGINTAIYSPSGGSIGIGFAIPSNIAREVANELISDPEHVVRRGWLGVRIQAVTDEVAETLGLDKPRGALVASVNESGPAQTGGIQPGDVILNFDGKPVSDVRHLPRVVAATKAGKVVPVTVWRKRNQETLQVAVGRLDETETAALSDAPKDKPSHSETATVTALGLTLSNITAELKDKFSLKDEKGVVVVDVASGSSAAQKGLERGDVILEASQQEIRSAGQIAAKIEEAKKAGRSSILVLVDRQGELRFFALRLDQG